MGSSYDNFIADGVIFLSFSSLIPFEISPIVNGESRIASCLLSEGVLLLPSGLVLSFSVTLNKLEKCSTHFFGGIESTWFGLLFVFPLSFLVCCQNSLGLLDKFSNTLNVFYFPLLFDSFNGVFVLSSYFVELA